MLVGWLIIWMKQLIKNHGDWLIENLYICSPTLFLKGGWMVAVLFIMVTFVG